jgi:diguanylate cyclase (GGDEF)-like protein/PAS domain S-box-containing protein
MTRQSITLLVLLTLLAVFGNFFSLPLFFGVDFVFGSIAVLVAIHLFGVTWGVVIALLASSYTVFLWGHPYAMLIFGIEALLVGFVWQHYKQNLLLLEALFWLVPGPLFLGLIYTFVIPLDTDQLLLIFLKKWVNGVANASFACLLITFLPLSNWVGQRVSNFRASLQQILLNLIIALVLLPAVIMMTVNGWLIIDRVKQEIKIDLDILSKNIISDLILLQDQHIQSLQHFAQIAGKTDLQDSNQLIQQARQTLDLFPEFLNLTVINTQGKILSYYSNTFNELNRPDFQIQPLESVLKKGEILTFQTSLTEKNTFKTIMAHAVPIFSNQKIIGALISSFTLPETLYKAHAIEHAQTYEAQITLTNEQGLIIESTKTDWQPFQAYGGTENGSTSWHNSTIYASFRQNTTHVMQQWRNAIYVQHTPLSPITIVVEIPLRPYLESWQKIYINQLIIISLIALLGMILGVMLSRWLVKPLFTLTQITDNLPTRLEKRQLIAWPNSQVREIESLTHNFKSTAKSLQARFEEIHSTNAVLEQRVQKRTQALLHERALLRNLIDSIPELICYKDCEGSYLGCNKAFEEFVGVKEAELIGKTHLQGLSNYWTAFCPKSDHHQLTVAEPQVYEEWVVNREGQSVLLDTLKTPFFAPDGRILGLIGISRDITARQQSQEALRQSQQMLRLVIDNIPQFIFWKDQQGFYLGCNQNFAHLVGVGTPNAIVNKTDDDLMRYFQPMGSRLFEILNRCISVDSASKYQYIESLSLDNGTYLWLEINNIPLRDSQGQVIGALGSFEDITERKKVEEKLKQWFKVLEKSGEAIVITDAQRRILQINQAFSKITGYQSAEVLGQYPSLLSSGKHDVHFYKKMWQSINTLGYWEGEIWNRRKNGEIYPEWLHISVIKDDKEQKVTHYLAIFSDLSVRKQTEQRLAYLAHYDDLTGLPNRTLFYERVSRALYHAQRKNCLAAVMFLDLDGFKYVNDTWGHPIGDLLLKKVAHRLMAFQSLTDTIARLGGDDFTFVLENIKNPEEVESVAQNILKMMQPPFELNGHETFISASIGISLYPKDGQEVETLLKHADAAMYAAKENGKNTYQFFTTHQDEKIHNRLIIETQLRYALERNELVLYYQPQVELATGRIVGAEVLLRWQHPEKGLVLPYAFIPLAEETGLIVQIGEWVFYKTCLQQQYWHQRGVPMRRLSVNLSSRQFKHDDLMKMVVNILEKTAIDPSLLALEITESLLIQDIDLTTKILYQLKDIGIQLAIDDFGTGYSSLSYLKRFPVDKLKIDQSFVRDIPKNEDDMHITKAIIALAHSLRMTVIAEGVETLSQQAFLKASKCDEIQGYLISRPIPEQAFIQLLENKQSE